MDTNWQGRRSTGPGEEAKCFCGSTWFELRGSPTASDVSSYGLVTVTKEGVVTGWAGEVHCVECGERWETSSLHLRAVE